MISIITATYNSAETINDTIKSVLCQTNKDFEYIIVDGGSTDETIDIVKSYESEFSGRLKWVSEKDKGIYDAMNKGIKMASGDIIGILNSDDYYTSDDILQTIADAFKCQNVDAIYGDIHFIKDGVPDKCVRYYSSRLFSPFGFVLVSCLLIHRFIVSEKSLTSRACIVSITRLVLTTR